MIEQYKLIHEAIGNDSVVPIHAYVLCQGGRLWATDGRLTASAPVPSLHRYLVHGEAFRKALEHLPDATVEQIDLNMRLKRGRARVTLKGLAPETFPLPDAAQDVFVALPDAAGVVEALRKLAKFRGDGALHPWSTGVYFNGTVAIATNNLAIAAVDCTFPFDDVLMPGWLVDFLLAAIEPPAEACLTASHLKVRWASGLELDALLMTDRFYAPAVAMAEEIDRTPSHVIPEDWREAVLRFATFDPNVIEVGETLRASTDRIELEDGVTIGGVGETRVWGTKLLAAAVEHATHMDLSGTMATWTGPGVRGLFAGRQ